MTTETVVYDDKVTRQFVFASVTWGLIGMLVGLVSLFLSHVFLSYFMPVETVFDAVVSPPSQNPGAFTFILIFTAVIYWSFAWFREQMCIVMCP